MSYSAGEALALTQVQACSSFNTRNTSRGNHEIINSGASAVYAILRPGETVRVYRAPTMVQSTHNTIIEVWQFITSNRGTTLTNLEADVDEIKVRFDQYRKLADTTAAVQDCEVSSIAAVDERTMSASGSNWMVQEVTLEWKEEETITFAE